MNTDKQTVTGERIPARAEQRDTAQPKHSITANDLIRIAHMTNEQWDKSEFNQTKSISEAYDIKTVDFRNLLSVAVGAISNQTGESFDNAMLRSKCADEILRRFKNAERLAEAVKLMLNAPHTRFAHAAAQGRQALVAWEGAQK